MQPSASTVGSPAHLGRYELVRHLASGGMADVLIARATGIEGFERHVVIKRIRAEQARDERFVQMFLDEARLAAALHHGNIVQVHDIGQADGEYFFAMEYVHGEDVRKLLMHLAERDLRLPLEHVMTIALAAAAALHYAHEHRGPDKRLLGVVHRDVSPANILVAYDGTVKVADFGIAKATQRTTETHSGLIKGKVAYMSPEQCLGLAVDRRSDIFCLGIVLYELATVRRLFKGANDFLTMSSITQGEVPPPRMVRPDLDGELEAIIMKALAPDVADRYQTADELRVALEAYATRAGLRSSTTGLADFMRAQFGEPPVPWLAEDDCEVELTYDFDGSASGIAASDGAPALDSALAGSPLAHARSRATARAEQSTGLGARGPSPTTQIAPRRSHVAVIAASAGAALALALVIAVIARGGNEPEATPPAASRAPAVTAPAAAPAERSPPPPSPPVAAPDGPKTLSREPARPPVVAPAVKPRPRPRPAKPARPPRGGWDPNALFPTKR